MQHAEPESIAATSITFSPPATIDRLLAADDTQCVFIGPPGQTAPPAWLPRSIPLPYSALVSGEPPAPGLMPPAAMLATALAHHGIDIRRPCVAWDMGGSGMAARFAFSVACLGGSAVHVLDGGLPAWVAAGFAVTPEPIQAQAVATPTAVVYGAALITADEIQQRLEDTSLLLLDTRSAAEFSGEDIRAARGGHIPGARHANWTDFMDPHGQLLPRDQLLELLAAAGLPTPPSEAAQSGGQPGRPGQSEHPDDVEIAVYCQTHHRSAHTYAVLKQLGYRTVRGYAGAWSEWAARPELPVEH